MATPAALFFLPRTPAMRLAAAAILVAPLLGVASTVAHATTAEELARCREIAAPDARLACYDALNPDSNPQPTAAAVSPPAATSPTDLFGLPTAQVRAVAARELGSDDLATLDATVTAVQRLPGGKLVLELDNGQRWRQVDSETHRLKAGDRIRIVRAALGSYLLTRTAGGAGMRVRRDR